MQINHARFRKLNNKKQASGEVIYWMSRDQRVQDNWALIFAQQKAIEAKVPLTVFFALTPSFLDANIRHYDFMLGGLKEIEIDLRKLGINFVVVPGEPPASLLAYCAKNPTALVVTDFSPLRISKKWRTEVASALNAPLFEVDAHNIIPCWHASPKLEYAAYTFRPKVRKLLEHFLTTIPSVSHHPHRKIGNDLPIDWEKLRGSLKVSTQVSAISWLKPGERAAQKVLNHFALEKLTGYDPDRNNPNANAQSNLSPYLHFGQISAQKIAFEISKLPQTASTQSFLEELIVRRELSDNFCFYQENYDSVDAFPNWAKESFHMHRYDKREFIYQRTDFENAKTHDPLWNAAQIEMTQNGKMHGYMRMYWAKKILEWTESPKDALKIAIYLNDKYELDGRDPNGYAGIAWSIGGVHDRPWFDRPIYGKVRYMNYNGCKSKFDVKAYIRSADNL